MFKIGVFSKINRITVKTLRHYDEIGLLKPCFVDETTGYRYYSADQMPRLHRILALRQIGFSLNEIMAALEQDIDAGTMIKYLEGKQAEVARTIQSERAKLAQIVSYIDFLKQEECNMSYNIILKELPEVIVASMRTVIPNYDAFNTIYPKMGKYMMEQKCRCAVPEYCFTIYHDGEYRESDIDVEICQAVVEAGKDSDSVKFKKIDGVETAACVLHKGPYSTIGRAYGAAMKWIEDNNYEIAGPPRESYLDGIWNKEDPEEWLTEVQIPVKRVG
ncbi:MAG: MerR family transcriptional regulator [Firmicutes bacterium HGW-Firmicutes-14]|jgi:DNA-binding transcriptional MerR regulator|nr:MAG: MerR family transcriptional regulator [Firmicutes bacterium HGW-Firmicutes-14]